MGPRGFFSILLFITFSTFACASPFPSKGDPEEYDFKQSPAWSRLQTCRTILLLIMGFMDGYRSCILNQIRNTTDRFETFPDFQPAVNSCAVSLQSNYPWHKLGIYRIPGPIETLHSAWTEKYKYAIPPLDLSTELPVECVSVLIGIDGVRGKTPDLISSYGLLKRAPECRLHFPYPIDDRNFTSIGQHHPVAIAQSTAKTCDVVAHSGEVIENTTCVTIKHFLETFDVKKPTFVDYLWIEDIWRIRRPISPGPQDSRYHKFGVESPAHSLLTHRPRNVTICQVMIYSPPNPGPEFKTVIMNILEMSDFVPLIIRRDTFYLREFYLNVGDPYCVAKYTATRLHYDVCDKATSHGRQKVVSGQFEVDAETIQIERRKGS